MNTRLLLVLLLLACSSVAGQGRSGGRSRSGRRSGGSSRRRSSMRRRRAGCSSSLHCDVCHSVLAGGCATCSSGYALNATMQCAACPPNCVRCPSPAAAGGAEECEQCHPGFMLSSMLLSSTTPRPAAACAACSAGCERCHDLSPAGCDSCGWLPCWLPGVWVVQWALAGVLLAAAIVALFGRDIAALLCDRGHLAFIRKVGAATAASAPRSKKQLTHLPRTLRRISVERQQKRKKQAQVQAAEASADGAEAVAASGSWRGFYTHGKGGREHAVCGVDLQFQRGGRLAGGGTDDVGAYTIKGRWGGGSSGRGGWSLRAVAFTKQYRRGTPNAGGVLRNSVNQGHAVEYRGRQCHRGRSGAGAAGVGALGPGVRGEWFFPDGADGGAWHLRPTHGCSSSLS